MQPNSLEGTQLAMLATDWQLSKSKTRSRLSFLTSLRKRRKRHVSSSISEAPSPESEVEELVAQSKHKGIQLRYWEQRYRCMNGTPSLSLAISRGKSPEKKLYEVTVG